MAYRRIEGDYYLKHFGTPEAYTFGVPLLE
jgi:hypothetical protein